MSQALDHLAARCAADSLILTQQLAAYQRRHNFTDADLANVLDCSVETLTRVRLCGRPLTDQFVADCRAIAADVIKEVCWP